MLSEFPPASVNVSLAHFFFGEVPEHIVMSDDTPSLNFTGLDPFDGIIARSGVEGPPPGRGSR
jgi:hypothetical protein